MMKELEGILRERLRPTPDSPDTVGGPSNS